jgi:hypothetical protein
VAHAAHLPPNQMEEPKTKEWLLLNAVSCWLHHYPDHPWTESYQALAKALTTDELTISFKAQGRRRPAKRQRKAQASKDKAS